MEYSKSLIHFGLFFSQIAGYSRHLKYSYCIYLSDVLCRIVNMSSALGRITRVSQERQDEILATDLTTEKLTEIVERFVK